MSAAAESAMSASSSDRGGEKEMKNPVKVGDGFFDKSEVAAVLRQDGRLLVFLKSGKPVTLPDNMSREEIEALIRE